MFSMMVFSLFGPGPSPRPYPLFPVMLFFEMRLRHEFSKSIPWSVFEDMLFSEIRLSFEFHRRTPSELSVMRLPEIVAASPLTLIPAPALPLLRMASLSTDALSAIT